MKSPITGKEMELVREPKTMHFRKEAFEVIYHSFRCPDSGEEFESEELVNLNLQQLYNKYRAKHHLPVPEEIRTIREKYRLSGAKMAEVLGFGTNMYRNYEAGEIPSISNARLIQLAKDPEEFQKLVELNDQLSDREKKDILRRIKQLSAGKERERRFIEQYLLKQPQPDRFSGYKNPDLTKFSHMTAFFAEQSQPWKVKMNKLLFYADFGHYKRFGVSISGARYIAITMGPVPNNFDGLFNWSREQELIHIKHHQFDDGMGEQYLPGEHPYDSELFTDTEMDILREVAAKFKTASTREIIALSHEEKGWMDCRANRQLIPYEYAFELKNF